MEQRKLIKLGNSSFAVALPKEWVTKSGLKKGDDVFVLPNSNGELIISPEFKKGGGEKVEIDLEDPKSKEEDFIKKKIHAAYIKGYDTLILKGGKKNTKEIKELLRDYVSLEIADSDNNGIIVKDFFDIKEAKFENFVRRIDNDLREMFDVILGQSNKNKIDPRILKEIEEIDKSVNKFYFLCSRIFIKGIDNPTIMNILKMDGVKLFINWWISFHLESLGDGLKYTLRDASKSNLKQKDEFYDVLSMLQEAYLKCMESFYEKDSEKAFEVINKTRKIKEIIKKLEKNNQENLKVTEALDLVEKNIYQNAKMISYMGF